MLMDQAHALRQLVQSDQQQQQQHVAAAPQHRAAARRARVIAVSSGKGGVGKSNVAVNLAIRLTMMGKRVLLVDADLGTANVDVLCNLVPGGTLAHVVAGRRSLQDAIIDAPGGFRLIPGASGLAQMAALSEFERAQLIQQLQDLEADADVILIDTGAGVGPNVMSFAVAADQLLVVTTPEPPAITDAYAVIKTASRRRSDIDVRIVVNMVKDIHEARAVFGRIDAVCRRFLNLSPRYAGHIAYDPRVAQAVRQRHPFVLAYPNCEASACVTQLAHRMDRGVCEPSGAGLFKRVVAWLAG